MLELRYYSYHKTFCHTVFFFSLLRIAKQANIFITNNKSVFVVVVVAFLNDPMSTKMGKETLAMHALGIQNLSPVSFLH